MADCADEPPLAPGEIESLSAKLGGRCISRRLGGAAGKPAQWLSGRWKPSPFQLRQVRERAGTVAEPVLDGPRARGGRPRRAAQLSTNLPVDQLRELVRRLGTHTTVAARIGCRPRHLGKCLLGQRTLSTTYAEPLKVLAADAA